MLDQPGRGRKSLADESRSSSLSTSSVRRISNETNIPSSSVQRILQNHLNLHPYRLQLLQELHESDKEKLLQFGNWFRNNEHQRPFIFWSHEANFHLNGDISRYHC